MRANVWSGRNTVQVENVPDPKILNDRDAIVKISSTAICGSDLHLYDGYIPTMKRGDILGHEFMGEVVETGKGVSNLQVGDRGTEIHVDLERHLPGGPLGEIAAKLTGKEPLAKVKDDLRRFKQIVETGEIARSDAAPEGELAERKLKQRPAQPLPESELEKVGA